MTKISFIFLSVTLFGIQFSLKAQSPGAIIVSGTVRDKDTKTPLQFTSISLKNHSLGTITNFDGEFVFSVPEELLDDTLIFSYVGYARESRVVREIKPGVHLNIFLEPNTTILDEVTVESRLLDARTIIRKAVSAISQNYPSSPFGMDGFFRELTKQDDVYVELREAVIRVYDKNFQRRLNHGITEEVSIVQGRKSVSAAHPVIQRVRKQNALVDLLDNNPVHYTRGLLNTKYFDYKIDSLLQTDDTIVYVISTIPGSHRIYVADGSYAILKTIEEVSSVDTLRRREFTLNDSLVVRRMVYFKAITEFQRFSGKYYLKYSNETDAYEVLDRSTRKRKFLVESFKELVITSVENESRPFSKDEKYNFFDDIVSRPYDSSFWNQAQVVHLSPINRLVQKDLERVIPLSEQFAKSGATTE